MKKYLSILLALLLAGGSSRLGAIEPVRQPAVAGAFYPADSSELAGTVSELLLHSRPAEPRARPLALVCPHAGYEYSGLVAAAGYRQLQGYSYRTVIVVAPSHREYFDYTSVWCRGAYRTPLGTLPVDSALAEALVAAGGGTVRCGTAGHVLSGEMGEHALEVQLPFLQTVLGNFSLVPVVMGEQKPENCRALGRAIAAAVGRRKDVLLVASSDLSHFHPDAEAKQLDSRAAYYIGRLDSEGLLKALATDDTEACGGGPVAAVMQAAWLLGADRSTVLAQANSGDATGDRGRVVGYLSAMLFRNADMDKSTPKPSNSGDKMGLTDQEKQYLLTLARKTIEYTVRGGPEPKAEAITPTLGQKRGAFVTIKKHGELRGCIGYIVAMKTLVETVKEMAVSAAVHDPRFSPVGKSELQDLELEISVLSPIYRVTDPGAIQVGRDGLIVRRGGYQGLLLPQVPTEYGWDRETFLAQTCRKAGLPPNAWKMEGTEIDAFSAEVFGDVDFQNK